MRENGGEALMAAAAMWHGCMAISKYQLAKKWRINRSV
jgi:hypothetical protein